MMPPQSALHRYLLAILIILLTLLTRLLMAPLWETTAPFALFMLAAVAAACFAGRGPTLLVGAAGIGMRLYYDAAGLQPSGAEVTRLVLFAAFLAGATWVTERMRADARGLAASLACARREIEERERTEQALRARERELYGALEEQKRMEILLISARLRAEEANRLKDEFLGMVSHELRTPLNAILGWTALMRSHALTPLRTGHAIDVIERNARHQAQLVGDLLDVARSLSGRLHLETERVDLAAAIDAAVPSIREAAAAKSVRLALTFEDRPLPVWGDARRLQQIAWNLLSNAVKFTPPDGLVALVAGTSGGCVQITVSDTGAGIAPEFLPHVFDRFTQADRGSTRTHGGLGLGLTLVRQLIELHRGTIEAESAGPGTGTRFTVRLPLHRCERDPDDLPPPQPAVPAMRQSEA
jgi:signal transduction histidine kinase